jgi:hypothetical protein
VVKRSRDWYRGWRDHLGYASVVTGLETKDESPGIKERELVDIP